MALLDTPLKQIQSRAERKTQLHLHHLHVPLLEGETYHCITCLAVQRFHSELTALLPHKVG